MPRNMFAAEKSIKSRTHLDIFKSKIDKKRWSKMDILNGKEIHYDRKGSMLSTNVRVPIWYSFDSDTGELIRLERYTEKINFDLEEDCNALNILYFHRGELYAEDFVEIRSGLPLYSWCDDLHYALREPKIINNPELEYEWISKQGQKLIDLGETICGHNEFYNSSWYFKKVLTEYGIRYIETESNYRPYQDYISSGRWINDI